MHSYFVVANLRDWDGIQCDYISNNASTPSFKNEALDQKWIDMGIRTMHAKLFCMLGNLKRWA